MFRLASGSQGAPADAAETATELQQTPRVWIGQCVNPVIE